MATPVEAPKLGNTVEECFISRWLKRRGDSVSAGDIVAEIETDKATFEVSAPVSGTVLEIFFDEGALVPVYTNMFVIGDPGERVETFRPSRSAAIVAQRAVEHGVVERVSEPVVSSSSPTHSAGYSPRARRFAEEHNFHPASVRGSGPSGRVMEEDLRRVYYGGPEVTPQKTSSRIAQRGSTIREKIAHRMRESLASTAQYTLNASADARGLLALRARIKSEPSMPDININDLVTFSTIKALLEMPELNSEFIDGKVHRHSEVHIGFACDTPRGLIVPVIRDAHALSIGDLSRQAKDLAARAVQGKISPDDLSGATFTISNLGGLGIESFTPLLNPPQVAILGVGAIQIQPMRRNGAIEFIDVIGLSLTCDHQVIDGAPGARFLQIVSDKIEHVESLCTI